LKRKATDACSEKGRRHCRRPFFVAWKSPALLSDGAVIAMDIGFQRLSSNMENTLKTCALLPFLAHFKCPAPDFLKVIYQVASLFPGSYDGINHVFARD
jgi:hypothetical protein